jgi:molybdopterin/thiamine biosynthesis adenylyltransferase
LFPKPIPLTPDEIRRHGGEYVRGWRVIRSYPEREVALDVLLDQDFPYSLPRVALAETPDSLTWPHVEDNGLLCLAPSGTTVSTETPDDAVRVLRRDVLKDAFELVGDLLAGRLEDHFLDEFRSYWTKGDKGNGRSFRSLLTLSPTSRPVAVFRGKAFYLLADTSEACEAWLNHNDGLIGERYTTETAAYIWLKRPPYPKEYPLRRGTFPSMVRNLSSDGTAVLADALKDQPTSLVIVLATERNGQREIGGLVLTKPGTDVVTRGFRPSKIPRNLLAARYVAAADAPLRSDVERVDHNWINGKDRNPSADLLRQKRVCILGCGSLGAGVGRLLAQSGVGVLHFVDRDFLDWPNTARHVLGAQAIRESKASSLARSLGRDLPHLLEVRGHPVRWQRLPSPQEFLTGFDLLVSATGDWNSDAALSDLQRDTGTTVPPAVYGWLEPHASAAHALLLDSTGACLRCGFAPDGQVSHPVTTWPPPPRRAEGDCADPYSPYGAVELGIAQSVVAQLTLDGLLGRSRAPEHRVWVGSRHMVVRDGGSWSNTWVATHGDPGAGQQLYQDDWPIRADCKRHPAA